MEIRIKIGSIEDAERLDEIEKACFPSELRYGPSILVAILTMQPNFTVLTVQLVESLKIIGFAVGEHDEDDETLSRIITIQIDPPYQRRQIGGKLLTELELKLDNEHKVHKYELQVHYKNEKAINFYKKQGYKIKKKLQNYYKRKEHAFLMEKILLQHNQT